MKIVARRRKKSNTHTLKVVVKTNEAIPTERVRQYVEEAIMLRYASTKMIYTATRQDYEVTVLE